MIESVIEIDRLPLIFLVAATPGRAERVSRRVRDAVTGGLPQALASACGTELDRDVSYVFIDRLEVQCAVASHWADDAIAGAFATRLSRALLLERDLGHALVFRDRPEFVSAFLAAAVEGAAFTRWWFAEFEGLSPLPLSGCIRTVINGEGPVAWQALARLAPETVSRVIAALGMADAERILEAVASGSGGADAHVTAIIESLEAGTAMPRASLSQTLIAALVHVAAHEPETVSPRTLAALRGLATIAEAARRGRLRVSNEAAHTILPAWCESAGLAPMERAALLHLEPAPLVAYIAGLSPADAVASTPPEARSFDFTPFGGALILCVVLVRAGWWVAWRDTLQAAGMGERASPLAAWLALAVVACALNPDDPAAVERDPVLRRVFGVPESMGVSRGRRLVRLARARGRALLHETARRIPGCEGSSVAYVRAQCLSLPAGVRADAAEARLGRPPLDVLLGFSGLKRASVTRPDGRTLSLVEEAHA